MCLPCIPGCPWSPCCRFGITYLVFWAIIFGSLGILCLLAWPILLKASLRNEMKITNGSLTYRIFIKNPPKVFIAIHVFNLTNANEVYNKDYVPDLQEIGPYVFKETRVRTLLDENLSAGTLTYVEKRKWTFLPNKSQGRSLADRIVHIDTSAAGLSYLAHKDFTDLQIEELEKYISTEKIKLHKIYTVEDLVFDNPIREPENLSRYSPLSQLRNHLNRWKTARNLHSHNNRRVFGNANRIATIFSGESDIATLGTLALYNHNRTAGAYDHKCDDIKGSSGPVWPPIPYCEQCPKSIFLWDLCRAFQLVYYRDFEYKDVDVNEWRFDVSSLESGRLNREALCYCPESNPEKCPPAGLIDVSKCWKSCALLISFPHFYLADSNVASRVRGLNPNPNIHRSIIMMDPMTGYGLVTVFRFQFNLEIRNNSKVKILNNVPNLIYPVFWYEEKSELDEEAAHTSRMYKRLKKIGISLAIFLLIIAFAQLVCMFNLLVGGCNVNAV